MRRWRWHHHHHHHGRPPGPPEHGAPPGPPFPPWPPWRGGPWHLDRHQRRRWREGFRYYTGAHLRRRLFWYFGATIFITLLTVGAFMGGERARHPGWMMALPAVALWVLSGRLARRIARPLDELVHVSGEIGRGNLSARAQLACGGIDEIAILARSINDMAGRIERQIADQRELLAGVSHELRTPLARLRVLLDIARERGASAQTYDELERELLEMDRLVGELLASARLEFQAVAARPLDAVEVARRALERAGLPAGKLSTDLTVAPFAGDPTLIARALANLLDNAVKHARGVECLRVSQRLGFVAFEVLDRGPGIPPELLDGKWKPFVRTATEPAAQAAPGLGLGLALVARIARAHGGSVQARNRDGGGAQLVLELAEKPA
jgi:signal transduction histidine kinase